MLARNRRVSKTSIPLFRKPIGSFSSGPLTMRLAKNNPGEPTRLSVVVSKKVAGSAVVRNRIRRRILGAAKEFILKSKPGFVCLIYPGVVVKTIPFMELKNHLRVLFTSARLL